LYVEHNKEVYGNGGKFVSASEFSVWLNNEYRDTNPDKIWITEVSSKSVKQSILNAEIAFKKFFKKQSKFPRFKKRSKQDVKMYFVKTDSNHTIKHERHKIKVPTLGWVTLKEFGYLDKNATIKSGTISEKAGKFWITVYTDIEEQALRTELNKEGIGVDLGITNLAIVSNETVFGNVNKTSEMKRLYKKLRREQRSLSRKYEAKKRNVLELPFNNIRKSIKKIQVLHHKISNKREEYIRLVVSSLVRTKPGYITIEDLNVSGMMKNKYLSKAVAQQCFYHFREWLSYQCKKNGIELRIANRFYPSSKRCNCCGVIKPDLKLKDRTFVCECGHRQDRDLNASLNLRDCLDFKIAA
jgi:putative transposase